MVTGMTFLKRLWEGWKKVGSAIGDFLARIVLSILYFTLVLPFGLITRLSRDPLDLHPKNSTQWQSRSTRDHTIEDGRRLS
jgi:hypothetical protein